MFRAFLYVVVFIDLAFLTGVNLAYHSYRLDSATERALARFNFVALVILILAVLLLLLDLLIPPSRYRFRLRRPCKTPSRWPEEPPE